MKRIYVIGAVCLLGQSLAAQTPYNNADYMQPDLIGSSRYVGMGGALGALGADLSAISTNPAALGLYRKSDAALSFSVLTQVEKPDLKSDMTHMSFDQMGFVYSLPVYGKHVKFFNVGFNYQKKANFNRSFIADNGNTGGLSQTMQMADILNFSGYSTPLADLMYDAYLVNPVYKMENDVPVLDEKDEPIVEGYDGFLSDANQYDRVIEGGIQSYEFNMSTNIKDRVYLGFTFGVDNVDYYSYSTYGEYFNNGSGAMSELYTLYNTQSVTGYGLNAKFGVIVRPMEFSPFRIGLAVESPTVYHLESAVGYSIDTSMGVDNEGDEPTYGDIYNVQPEEQLANLQMKVTTPWKVRVSLGHTIDKYLAIGAEYEYANYSKTRQGYEEWGYDYWGDWHRTNSTRDPDMNALHKQTLKGVHSFKLGFELNLTDNVALRAGYNYYTSMFKDGAALDQTGDSPAFNYQTTTDFMNKGDVNIITAGLGYHGKHFYADAAYKFRKQSGQFYAFDDYYISNPGEGLTPIDVNLDTHQVFFSLGFKF